MNNLNCVVLQEIEGRDNCTPCFVSSEASSVLLTGERPQLVPTRLRGRNDFMFGETTPTATTPRIKSLVCGKTMDLLNKINFSTPTKRVCTTREQKRKQTKRKKRREWEAFQRNIARTTAAAVIMQEEVSTLISSQKFLFV